MEHQKAKKEEIQNKIYQAKTVEELLAIAVEAGETLTPEDAAKLLQELEAERATAKKEFQSADDLTDEELAKVSGGRGRGDNVERYRYPATELTYRDGDVVKINFSSAPYLCRDCTCRSYCGKGFSFIDDELRCNWCRKQGRCKNCAFRQANGYFNHDICFSPTVRKLYGLPG